MTSASPLNPHQSDLHLSPAAQDALKDYPVQFVINVAWGEMDAFGHVNNVAYFRYFESARIAYGRRVGMHKEFDGAPSTYRSAVAPIVASTSARYKRALQFPDTIIVGVKVSKLTNARFSQHYRIFSTSQDCISTEGEADIVCFDYALGQKTGMPAELRARIETLEGHGFGADGAPLSAQAQGNAP